MKNNKKYVLHISGLEENCKYSYPTIVGLPYSKFKKKNKEAIALGLITEINQKYNKHLYKMLKKISKAQPKIDVKAVFIKTDLLDKTIDLLFKGSLYSFKIHTATSDFDYKFGDVFSGNKQFPPLFCIDSFTGPESAYSTKRAVMKEQQSMNHFSTPEIKLPSDASYTEQTSVSHFDANEEGSQPERVVQIATSPDFNGDAIVFDDTNNNSTGKKLSMAELATDTSNTILDGIRKIKDAKEDNMWFAYRVYKDIGDDKISYRIMNSNKPASSATKALAFVNESIIILSKPLVFIINTNEAEQIGVTIYPNGNLSNPSPFIIVDNINDVEKLFTNPLIGTTVICKKNIWDKLNKEEEKEVAKNYKVLIKSITGYDVLNQMLVRDTTPEFLSDVISFIRNFAREHFRAGAKQNVFMHLIKKAEEDFYKVTSDGILSGELDGGFEMYKDIEELKSTYEDRPKDNYIDFYIIEEKDMEFFNIKKTENTTIFDKPTDEKSNLEKMLVKNCLDIVNSHTTSVHDKTAMIIHEVQLFIEETGFDSEEKHILFKIGGKYIVNSLALLSGNVELTKLVGKRVVITRMQENRLFTIQDADGVSIKDVNRKNLSEIIPRNNKADKEEIDTVSRFAHNGVEVNSGIAKETHINSDDKITTCLKNIIDILNMNMKELGSVSSANVEADRLARISNELEKLNNNKPDKELEIFHMLSGFAKAVNRLNIRRNLKSSSDEDVIPESLNSVVYDKTIEKLAYNALTELADNALAENPHLMDKETFKAAVCAFINSRNPVLRTSDIQMVAHEINNDCNDNCKLDGKIYSDKEEASKAFKFEIKIGELYRLNGSNDLGMNAEIRPYIGGHVYVLNKNKNGLFTIICTDSTKFKNIAKYNLSPIFKDKSNFNVNISECNNPGPILTKFMDDVAKEKTIVPESKEKLDDVVSEYLDNTEYDAIIEYITNKTNKEDMSTVVSKKDSSFLTYLPSDFRARMFDLSDIPGCGSKFKYFYNPLGYIQDYFFSCKDDKTTMSFLCELTFEQLLELFTVLASMKGMIFDDDINKTEVETQKPKLTYNGIHLADIESIKIEKFAILLIMPTAKTGTFGKDSRKVVYELYDNIDLALETINQTLYSIGKYSLLKYNSIASNLFSSILPEKLEASFSVFNGRLIKVLIDIDSWFYIPKPTLMGLEFECKNIEFKEQHNTKATKQDLHSAIEILDNEVEKKYTFESKSLCDKILDNIEKEAEEIKTSYTMAAIKDGQYLFIDDCTCKIGEDRSAAFNSMLRAEGHKEEVFYALYSFEDKVRCNYYIDAANVKDKIISAVYVSSSYSDCNKNIVLKEHQKVDVEDVKLDIKIESNNEPTEEMKRIIHGNPVKHRIVLKNNSRKQNANNAQEDEMVFIITPCENDIFDIIYKSKSELETNEELINYRTKFINPSSNLFVLIKNHLLYMAESDNYNLTKEQISSVNKIYVPSHTIGLHYKITPAAGIFSLDIIFSYSLQEYDSIDNLELQRGRNARKAFYDFKEEE